MLEILIGALIVVLIVVAWLLYRDVNKREPVAVEAPAPPAPTDQPATTVVVIEDEPLPWWYYSGYGVPVYGGWGYGGYGGYRRFHGPHGGLGGRPHGGWGGRMGGGFHGGGGRGGGGGRHR